MFPAAAPAGQKEKQAGQSDQGLRGGAQMDGFVDLFAEIILAAGIPGACVYRRKDVELPGFFRPTKEWDLLVIQDKSLGKPYEPNAIIKNDMEFILMQRKPGGYRQPSTRQRDESRIGKEEFGRWFQQIWNITGASTKHHPAPFPLELATRLVRMFSFTGDTVLDPFCGSGTTMVAALRTGRNSIGIDIEPEYCRMAARYLKAENADLFASSKLLFEKVADEPASLVKEDHALYEVRPAKKRLE